MDEPLDTAALIERRLGELRRSRFRARFRLRSREADYARTKGRDTIRRHALDFITNRIAPAQPARDGRQTPHAQSPRLRRPARHRHLLPGLPRTLARHRKGTARSPKPKSPSAPISSWPGSGARWSWDERPDTPVNVTPPAIPGR